MQIAKFNNKYNFIDDIEIIKQFDNKKVYRLSFEENFNTSWIEDADSLTLPKKLYDIDDDIINMVDIDFKQSDNNIGVLLVGNKGQGKSITAKRIALNANKPIVIIDKKIPKAIDFIPTLKQIKQDYVLFIDEFEKIFDSYDNDDYHNQKSFLSFMDGISSSNNKILFILTSNNEINEYFINRPARIKYLKEYLELNPNIFNQICDDLITNQQFKDDLLNSVSMINLNVDLLISIINTMNKFNKPFSEFKNVFNYSKAYIKYDMWDETNNQFLGQYLTSELPKIDLNNNYYGSNFVNDFKIVELLDYTKSIITFKTSCTQEKYDSLVNKKKINPNLKSKAISTKQSPNNNDENNDDIIEFVISFKMTKY